MVKEKPNSTRIYDEDGFRRRAAAICVKNDLENEVSEYHFIQYYGCCWFSPLVACAKRPHENVSLHCMLQSSFPTCNQTYPKVCPEEEKREMVFNYLSRYCLKIRADITGFKFTDTRQMGRSWWRIRTKWRFSWSCTPWSNGRSRCSWSTYPCIRLIWKCRAKTSNNCLCVNCHRRTRRVGWFKIHWS